MIKNSMICFCFLFFIFPYILQNPFRGCFPAALDMTFLHVVVGCLGNGAGFVKVGAVNKCVF